MVLVFRNDNVAQAGGLGWLVLKSRTGEGAWGACQDALVQPRKLVIIGGFAGKPPRKPIRRDG